MIKLMLIYPLSIALVDTLNTKDEIPSINANTPVWTA